MPNSLYQILERSPIIAAVFDTTDLEIALQSPCEAIFLLCGNICELEVLMERARKQEKKMYIHLDLLGGVGKDQHTIRYLKKVFNPDGIITTKSNIARYAKEEGLFVIQRFFMLDSKSFESALKTVLSTAVDAVEILPGVVPDIIRQISRQAKMPVIAGGLVRGKKEAIAALNAGAMGVSTSCKELWNL